MRSGGGILPVRQHVEADGRRHGARRHVERDTRQKPSRHRRVLQVVGREDVHDRHRVVRRTRRPACRRPVRHARRVRTARAAIAPEQAHGGRPARPSVCGSSNSDRVLAARVGQREPLRRALRRRRRTAPSGAARSPSQRGASMLAHAGWIEGTASACDRPGDEGSTQVCCPLVDEAGQGLHRGIAQHGARRCAGRCGQMK